MNRVLIDTNIFIYSIDQESIYYDRSRKILASPQYHKVTTSKNLVEFLSVVTRPSGYDIDPDVALEILEEVILGIEIIYPDQESLSILWQLLHQYQIKGLQTHDVEIASIGLAAGVCEIASFNEKDFRQIKEVHIIEL